MSEYTRAANRILSRYTKDELRSHRGHAFDPRTRACAGCGITESTFILQDRYGYNNAMAGLCPAVLQEIEEAAGPRQQSPLPAPRQQPPPAATQPVVREGRVIDLSESPI